MLRDNAKVSVFDSGFLLGDGIWEGLRLNKKKWVFFEDHIKRLFEALKLVEIKFELSKDQILQELEKTRLSNDMHTDVYARFMVTRGKKSKPFQHPDFSIYGSTYVIIMEHSKPSHKVSKRNLKLITVPQVRGLPMTQDPKLNSHSKLNCVLACIQATRVGGDEALMLDPYGFVNTTNSCNFFIVKGKEVWTSTGDYCMNGVTRQKVINLCRNLGIPIFEKNFTLLDTYSADEIFLTGTFGGLTKVDSIDGHSIFNKNENSILQILKNEYQGLIEKY